MAYILLTSPESKLCKIVFKNLTPETAKVIADHMNRLSDRAAKQTGQTIKLVYRVIGK